MTIQALGYLGIGTDKLDDWTDYATNWLGMQAVNRGAGLRAPHGRPQAAAGHRPLAL